MRNTRAQDPTIKRLALRRSDIKPLTQRDLAEVIGGARTGHCLVDSGNVQLAYSRRC